MRQLTGPNLLAVEAERRPGCCGFCDRPIRPARYVRSGKMIYFTVKNRMTCADPVCQAEYRRVWHRDYYHLIRKQKSA